MAVMLSVIGACMVVMVAGQQGPYDSRELPADVLRDFPGHCFGSTVCRVFNVTDSWPLIPFCGKATCIEKDGKLFEKIDECSAPKYDSSVCQEVIPTIVDPATGVEHPAIEFPDCCLKVQCVEGYEWTPEYYTREEALALATAAQASAAQPGQATTQATTQATQA